MRGPRYSREVQPPCTGMTEELKKLGAIISSSINTIINICELRGEEFPSLNFPAQSIEFSPDGIRNDRRIADAVSLGIAAAAQLVATLQPPHVTLLTSSTKVRFSIVYPHYTF